ncbi:hypothetical protein K1719_037614 [Acacia pycnantha]|nr:hypothetical protein K1719_037614 [Acacia pycnantha]
MASPLSSARRLSLFVVVLMSLGLRSCYGFQTLGFTMHHRYSDPVKGILGIHDLPARGSREYYVAMTHRDRLVRGRGLAGVDPTALTFSSGNDTLRIASLGYLHYANVSVGTPPVWFLVALDTGSDLFWLPCNCTKLNCVHALGISKGQILNLNIYDPHASSTSKNVPCNSTICTHKKQCPSNSSCAYQVRYLTENTSSTGVLVEDVLHLVTDDNQTKQVDAHMNFGCGKVQTGSFLTGAAPNGLFGLGIENISVPSILAKKGLTSNSFSMCFGDDGSGRIRFGDNGSSDQRKTPINHLGALHPSYNISITQIIVGEKATDSEFNAIFDTGTSFTNLNDPAYINITSSFNSMVRGKRYQFDPRIEMPFEYCYENATSNQTSPEFPSLTLKMKGGDSYYVIDPFVYFVIEGIETFSTVICLGIVKSDDVNIIGQNFMTGYHLVFDRDNMILGWKNSSCYDDKISNTAYSPAHSPAVSPAKPEAMINQSETSRPQIPNHSFKDKPFVVTFLLLILSPVFATF